MRYEIVVIGGSWGGLQAVGAILQNLPREFRVPIVVAQHQLASFDGDLTGALAARSSLPVEEVDDKHSFEEGRVYIAPPDYHTLVDRSGFSLSTDELVNFSRPSIDVLFESAGDAFGAATIGVILTGANHDGAAGLAAIKKRGGYTIVQDPQTASQAAMPQAALDRARPRKVVPLDEIAPLLARVTGVRTDEKAKT